MKTFWDVIAHQLKSRCQVVTVRSGKEKWALEATIKGCLKGSRFFTVEPMPDGLYEICIKVDS